MNKQTTNYLSPELLYTFKESLIRTHPFIFGKPPMKANNFTFLVDVLYGCGLRVSEGLNLIKLDFNLNGRILTIRNPKTKKQGVQKTTILPYHVSWFERMLQDLKPEDILHVKDVIGC